MPRLTLFKKILVITLLLSLLPLMASSLILFLNLETTSARLTSEISDTADIQASESLRMRAVQVAESMADFLRQRESDLVFLSRSQLDKATLLNFYDSRRGEIWYRSGSSAVTPETRELVPLYRSIAIIDKEGREKLVIRDGAIVPAAELRNVADPAGTEFLSEDYFNRVRSQPGKIYVSHLTGFHISKQDQLNGADEPEHALDGKLYRGVIRFAAALFDAHGSFNGMVVIALDHRHLMEFTQHIDPGHNFSTVFPSYKSGNYAFMFDDEGWIITHPKYWDIRGFDARGKLVPPYSETSTKADIENGRIPFNLDYAGFIHPNYPVVAELVRKRKAGFVDTTNVGGAKKIMAFAPILYDSGDYARHGVFGGITIGFQLDQFQDAARKGSRLINQLLGEHRTRSGVILLITSLLAALSAWGLSRGITRPLLQLTEGAHKLAGGDISSRVQVSSSDEVGELGRTFNLMADELEIRKNSLLATLDELQRSRVDILDERNFKTSILESISSAIITISPAGTLTSINGVGQQYLSGAVSLGMEYHEVFAAWPDVCARIEAVLLSKQGYGREPLNRQIDGESTYYDVGIFPIGTDAEMGLTVTLRNETEREHLREETVRLDRLASLGKLSAGIAHEVRNPLTGISLLLDDLHDKPGFNAEDKEMLSKALSEIERVERLISALLNYSSPVRTAFRDGDLTQILKDILLLMRRQAEKQGVELNVRYTDLPHFRFDPEKIRQALINILKNALEVLDSGGVITITTGCHDTTVTVTIHDNGPGIPQQDLPLIFEPYFTRKGAGTGLGLSITQRIIAEHHGTLSVESNGPSGTTFRITLPLDNRPF
ncbi:MAG: ATP-binding protein [Desulfuromonadaceae bacterium]|nr:ATP-binding protein [Desulfuromonadaceae bacterium]MDD2849161.1 ATP-binding protein [Desulfuromonadaceae bacterium]MDD4129529.1 ATP-binding protein [Desulfuromonadaceae bacterium]